MRHIRLWAEDVVRDHSGGVNASGAVFPRSLFAKTKAHVPLLEWALRRSLSAEDAVALDNAMLVQDVRAVGNGDVVINSISEVRDVSAISAFTMVAERVLVDSSYATLMAPAQKVMVTRLRLATAPEVLVEINTTGPSHEHMIAS